MACRPYSPDQKPAVMTPPSFLSELEMRSAACDGPNGMLSRRGPGLVPLGDRSLAPQHPTSTKHDGLAVPLSEVRQLLSANRCCSTAPARTSRSAPGFFFSGGRVRRLGSPNAHRGIKGAKAGAACLLERQPQAQRNGSIGRLERR